VLIIDWVQRMGLGGPSMAHGASRFFVPLAVTRGVRSAPEATAEAESIFWLR